MSKKELTPAQKGWITMKQRGTWRLVIDASITPECIARKYPTRRRRATFKYFYRGKIYKFIADIAREYDLWKAQVIRFLERGEGGYYIEEIEDTEHKLYPKGKKYNG